MFHSLQRFYSNLWFQRVIYFKKKTILTFYIITLAGRIGKCQDLCKDFVHNFHPIPSICHGVIQQKPCSNIRL